MGKQDLCEWTSQALRAALTPNNIKAGFRSTGIWLLDRTALREKMNTASGFERDCEASGAVQIVPAVTGPADHPGAATGEGDRVAGHCGGATGAAGGGVTATGPCGDGPVDEAGVRRRSVTERCRHRSDADTKRCRHRRGWNPRGAGALPRA